MLRDGKIWIANKEDGSNIYVLPQMANRHGLIAGATGTGKTVTLKVLAETFSDMGVPVFLADVKGDLAGMCCPGTDSEDMQKRIERFGLAEAGFQYQKYPVTFWDIYGQKGIQLRTTISEMGPLLLSRILGLNELQTDLLTIAFDIADRQQLLLIDTKDLKAMLNYMSANRAEYEPEYGKISANSINVIIRAVAALESSGGETFFGDPALNIADLFQTDSTGRGMINILDSESLIGNGRLYSTFLLWLLSELFEALPEVGDVEKPKMVFFFDEAHLLFKDAPQILLDKIEQVVKLVRSKGVGIYFCTQNPRDIPDGVLAQLGNKIEHGLRAYTPSDQKAVKAAAAAFRTNPEFDTYETLMQLGVGEAIVSFLDEDGIPGVAEKVSILPPQSRMGSIDDSLRTSVIDASILSTKYAMAQDPDSAYEFLQRKVSQEAADAQKAAEEAAKAKEEAKEQAKAEKEEAREEKKKATTYKKAAKSVGNSVVGTVGREVGKSVGGALFGKFGKTLGGNLGASLGRGVLSTLFKL